MDVEIYVIHFFAFFDPVYQVFPAIQDVYFGSAIIRTVHKIVGISVIYVVIVVLFCEREFEYLDVLIDAIQEELRVVSQISRYILCSRRYSFHRFKRPEYLASTPVFQIVLIEPDAYILDRARAAFCRSLQVVLSSLFNPGP